MNETGQPNQTPTDRTVENMIAAVTNVEAQLSELIRTGDARGSGASAKEALALVGTIKVTYETMLPK